MEPLGSELSVGVTEVQVLATQRQQYAQQANENNLVKLVRLGAACVGATARELNRIVSQEMDLLDDDAKVFKLIGPVLLKQEVNEAKTNVKKRLEFINNELYS